MFILVISSWKNSKDNFENVYFLHACCICFYSDVEVTSFSSFEISSSCLQDSHWIGTHLFNWQARVTVSPLAVMNLIGWQPLSNVFDLRLTHIRFGVKGPTYNLTFALLAMCGLLASDRS